MNPNAIKIVDKGLVDYTACLHAMRSFTHDRDATTEDELWLVEHPPVFTQGVAGKAEHLLTSSTIPVVQSDRGGQITYHGPGQLILYPLLDLNRKAFNIHQTVKKLEQIVIDCLTQDYGINAQSLALGPGVYVGQAKLASIGLRVKKFRSFHGIAINIAMDLSPFTLINPCGFPDLQMTQVSHFIPDIGMEQIKPKLITYFCQSFGYDDVKTT